MNSTLDFFDRVRIALAITLLAGLTGCAGYVDGGGGYNASVVVPGPDVGFYGGFYDRGVDVHAYHDRGFRSRGFAHGGGGRKR
ncbi:MAG TPA: hypothetical protein VGR14_19590 [Verrucomicrobiae bacterium]|jgi:hypothetical protein|nr:hypothetical protein [Verrucomicrobiae bacterium]